VIPALPPRPMGELVADMEASGNGLAPTESNEERHCVGCGPTTAKPAKSWLFVLMEGHAQRKRHGEMTTMCPFFYRLRRRRCRE
jgi:hypothetical protein